MSLPSEAIRSGECIGFLEGFLKSSIVAPHLMYSHLVSGSTVLATCILAGENVVTTSARLSNSRYMNRLGHDKFGQRSNSHTQLAMTLGWRRQWHNHKRSSTARFSISVWVQTISAPNSPLRLRQAWIRSKPIIFRNPIRGNLVKAFSRASSEYSTDQPLPLAR